VKGRDRFAVKLHRWLLRLLRPALGEEYVLDASATFRDLYSDSRSAPRWQRARLWVREIGALAGTAFSELRASGAGREQATRKARPRHLAERGASTTGL
jgi:hypothetical protein